MSVFLLAVVFESSTGRGLLRVFFYVPLCLFLSIVTNWDSYLRSRCDDRKCQNSYPCPKNRVDTSQVLTLPKNFKCHVLGLDDQHAITVIPDRIIVWMQLNFWSLPAYRTSVMLDLKKWVLLAEWRLPVVFVIAPVVDCELSKCFGCEALPLWHP